MILGERNKVANIERREFERDEEEEAKREAINHLTTGVVDQLLVVKPHCVSNAIGLIK